MQLCGDKLERYGGREEGRKYLARQPGWATNHGAEAHRVFFATVTNHHIRGLKKKHVIYSLTVVLRSLADASRYFAPGFTKLSPRCQLAGLRRSAGRNLLPAHSHCW